MRKLLIILFVLMACANSYANGSEKRVEKKDDESSLEAKATFISLYYGVSNYLGDLGGNSGIGKKFFRDQNHKQRTFFSGISMSHIRKEALGFRLSYISGSVAGSDHDAVFGSRSDPAFYRYKRNLDFRSTIKEWSLQIEAYPLKFLQTRTRWHRFEVQPYLLFGFGRFKFNPQGSFFDEIADDYIWIDLAPLRTEGQGMKEYPNRNYYKLSQTNLLHGIGVQYKLGRKASLSIEFLGRMLFTDYLDDVSTNFINPSDFSKYLDAESAEIAASIHNKSELIDPDRPYYPGEKRGNPKHNDYYYSMNLRFSIQISKQRKTEEDRPMFKPDFRGRHFKYDNMEICE